MKLKRCLPLAAALLLAALVLAAVASAAVWKDKGSEVKEKREFTLTGAEQWETPEGGMNCGVKAKIVIESGTVSKITEWNWNGEACGAFGEKYAKCTAASYTAQSLPWTLTVEAGKVTAANAKVKHTFAAGCPILTLESTVPSLTLTPDVAEAIGELELEGTGTAKKEKTTTVEYKANGSLNVDEAFLGTYGIG